MKKLFTTVVALLIVAALVMSASAYPLYVNSDPGKVHKHNSKDSDVISRLPFGGAVDVYEDDGHGWAHISYINKKGQVKTGWMMFKHLSALQPHKHSWGPWRVTIQPSCDHKGLKVRTCATCGATQSKEIGKTKHQYGPWQVTKAATCVQKGERTRVCQICGHREKKSFLADHDYTPWTMTREPSCTQTGERVRTCRVCGKQDHQTLDKLAHSYEWRVLVEPTDHSCGTRAKICTVCGYDGGEESFDPEGTLRRKARGDAVYSMQQRLVELGYLNAGGADGAFGAGTEKALKQFQADEGLTADGVAWPQTLQRLNHDFGPWETVKEMTRTEPGERRRVCKDCGYEQHEVVESSDGYEIKSRGEEIRVMQQILGTMGYDVGSFDGIYGGKLDKAMAKFAGERGVQFVPGRIRPAEVDALMNAWFETMDDDTWKGEGDATTPVNLALTLDVVGADDANCIKNYAWTLTNLGSEKAHFVALLLTFGDSADFKRNNLVMVLDGEELKPNAGNSVSGTFSADDDWGEGSLNFAALAVSDQNGAKWLSNEVTFANSNTPAPKTVYPLAGPVDVNNLADAVLPVSFNQGDVAALASGAFINAIHIYSLDTYDVAQIESLRAGDTLMVGGEAVEITSAVPMPIDPEVPDVREMEINGGNDGDGFMMVASPDSDGYVVRMLSDVPTYTEQGVTSLMLDPECVYNDSSDLDAGTVSVSYDGIVDAIRGDATGFFVPYNTTITVAGNRITEINREYVP
ncbi:MAG: peptidoglycan-binding protein [Clostridia bacterium]|nr:peptidoglycan-binding protein [Clostridia bacterium]